MDFLTPVLGETGARIVIIALVVLLLGAMVMLLVGATVRAFNGRLAFFKRSRGRAPRLAVPDTLTVDSRRKLVLVRRDNVEHLLLIGGSSDIVIEPAIQRYTANSRTRPAPGARPEAAAPQPAAVTTGSNGTARPLAARSQQAVQAGYPPGESRASALPRAGLDTGAQAGTARPPELRTTQATQNKDGTAGPGDKADRPRPAPAVITRGVPEAGASSAQDRDSRPGPGPARPASLQQTAAQPATADRPNQPASAQPTRQTPDQATRARPTSPGGAAAPVSEGNRPAAPAARTATSRPTAAAQPPAGHPSNPPAKAEPSGRQAGGERPSEPLPRTGAGERQAPEKRANPAESDPDMTALLGEIFGQNKH